MTEEQVFREVMKLTLDERINLMCHVVDESFGGGDYIHGELVEHPIEDRFIGLVMAKGQFAKEIVEMAGLMAKASVKANPMTTEYTEKRSIDQ